MSCCLSINAHWYTLYTKHIGSSGLPEIQETVTIVNHEGEVRVICIVTVECISVVNHYILPMLYVACMIMHVVTASHVLTTMFQLPIMF
jgi:hypothetical protein